MAIAPALQRKLDRYVDENRPGLVRLIQDLVRIPSENSPPSGNEAQCQHYVAEFLRKQGLEPDVYTLNEVAGLREHPLYWPGREYRNRPNVDARRKGQGGGRSLVLSGHIDTVPRGTQPWTRDAFGAEVEGNRLYGRGSNDMKAGVAGNLHVVQALRDLNIRLQGDLVIETVVDEEFGGVNGTLAARLRGHNADGAVITEPTALKICPAQRGGRIAHITLKASGGILQQGRFPAGIEPQLKHLMNRVEVFREQRLQRVRVHELYKELADPVPVTITKVFTSPWGTGEPTTVPEVCQMEIYWQTMPGETQANIEGEFSEWFNQTVNAAAGPFSQQPEVSFPIRWLPGSAISSSEPLVREFVAAAAGVLGAQPPVIGFDAPCDMYIFHQMSGTPALLWGPSGGNTHAADEYVEIDSVLSTAKALLSFTCSWCGVAD